MSVPSLDFGFPEEIVMLRDTVRAFAQAEIAPRAAGSTATTCFPPTCGGNSGISACSASR